MAIAHFKFQDDLLPVTNNHSNIGATGQAFRNSYLTENMVIDGVIKNSSDVLIAAADEAGGISREAAIAYSIALG